MNTFICAVAIPTKAGDGSFCKKARVLVKGEHYKDTEQLYFVDQGSKVEDGEQIFEVINTIQSKSGMPVNYVRPIEMGKQLIDMPPIYALISLSSGQNLMKTSKFFELCRMGVQGSISLDSEFWYDLYMDAYRMHCRGTLRLEPEVWKQIHERCENWFANQMQCRQIRSKNLLEKLEEEMKSEKGYPKVFLTNPVGVLMKDVLVDGVTPDMQAIKVNAYSMMLDPDKGTCLNLSKAYSVDEVEGKSVMYVTRHPHISKAFKNVLCATKGD